MSDPRDPDEAYRAMIRLAHDRQRRTLLAMVPLMTGGLTLILTLAVVIAGLFQAKWVWGVLAICIAAASLSAWGFVLLAKIGPSPDAERLMKATPWFEQIQQGRIYWSLYVFILIFGLMPMFMSAAGDVVSGEGNFARAINAAVGLMLVSMPVMVLTGRDGSITPKMRKYLDDEHTQAIRTRAMSLGFVVMMVGVTTVYLLGLWRKELAVVLILPMMAVVAFIAVGRFALLERAAERGDDRDG